MAEYIVGRNAVMEYLRSEKEAEKLFIQKGERQGSIHRIVALARERGLIIVECDAHKLNELAEGQAHQGVALFAQDYRYASISEMLSSAREKGHAPFLILLDEISDPHNLGAIVRTAECVGADGVIIPKRRAATVTSIVHKSAAGATTYMKIARVNNINQTIDLLKKENIWVYGAAGEASQSLWDTDFSGGVCLVIGNEGAGLSRLTREKCDALVSIPMVGQIESLNASASAAVLMYEVFRGRFRS
ncbi:MAG: 23S rRNA (guanosine(2251)-2'-O)-methyltransferase RlmB [Ndongobacter sp.]|nr:23S rRNA (guanosine(2251)-2'-O)-methyltransferase RlmB [Ndongobacter sp.]